MRRFLFLLLALLLSGSNFTSCFGEPDLTVVQADSGIISGEKAGVMNYETVLLALLILLGIVAVVSVTMIVIERREKSRLRHQLAQSDPVIVLKEQALELIQAVQGEVRARAKQINNELLDNRNKIQSDLVDNLSQHRQIQNEARGLIDQFRQQMNSTYEGMGKFLRDSQSQLSATQRIAMETKDHAAQVADLIVEKEKEIGQLREGFHLELIKPLISGFIRVADSLREELREVSDESAVRVLTELGEQVDQAFKDLNIERVEIVAGEDPGSLDARFWETFAVAEPTEDERLGGKVARIHRDGYRLVRNGSEPVVIRKSLLVLYRFRPAPQDVGVMNNNR